MDESGTPNDPPALERLAKLDPPAEPARRASRWDRPKQPKDWRWWVGGVGKALIVLGLMIFAFVGYQLWGTGIEESQAQNRLEDQFAELSASLGTAAPATSTAPTTTVTTTTTTPNSGSSTSSSTTTSTTSTTTTVAPVAIVEGDPVAIIDIPRIGLRKFVVAGVEPADLKKGPGHYPSTVMPGERGNAGIAGHRTTYGSPFRQLDELEPGDEVSVTVLTGETFVYRVTGSIIVEPSDSWVLDTNDPEVATLTLTTCHPEYQARQRLVVFAELDVGASPPIHEGRVVYADAAPPDELVGEETAAPSATSAPNPTLAPDVTLAPDDSGGTTPGSEPDPTDGPDATDPVDTATPATDPTDGAGGGDGSGSEADAFNRGWFSDPSAWPHVLLWGAALAAVTVAAYLAARATRRTWVGLLLGIAPFLFVLYFFFQNVNRLLPPNL